MKSVTIGLLPENFPGKFSMQRNSSVATKIYLVIVHKTGLRFYKLPAIKFLFDDMFLNGGHIIKYTPRI